MDDDLQSAQADDLTEELAGLRALTAQLRAPLQGKARRGGATVFLDLATMEPHDDQWAYFSTLSRMSPAEANRVARCAGGVTVGTGVDRIGTAVSTRIRAAAPPVVHARLSSGIRLESGELTPALRSTSTRVEVAWVAITAQAITV